MCEKVLFHYKDESYHNGTQLIFCDMGVSKQHSQKIDVYADILKKLVQKGIPQEQIAFIGDAKTDIQKQELFMKLNEGAIRILIGSTTKMGTGTNVQKKNCCNARA